MTNGGSATAIGVRLNNADRGVREHRAPTRSRRPAPRRSTSASTNLLTTRWNDITVTGSGTGAIRLSNTTGQPVLGRRRRHRPRAADDVGGHGGAGHRELERGHGRRGRYRHDLRHRRAGGRHPQLQRLAFLFDSVSSTNSAGDGINLDTNLTTPFTASTGAIAGAAGIALSTSTAAEPAAAT